MTKEMFSAASKVRCSFFCFVGIKAGSGARLIAYDEVRLELVLNAIKWEVPLRGGYWIADRYEIYRYI